MKSLLHREQVFAQFAVGLKPTLRLPLPSALFTVPIPNLHRKSRSLEKIQDSNSKSDTKPIPTQF